MNIKICSLILAAICTGCVAVNRTDTSEENLYSILALDYFTMRDIGNIVFFLCWSSRDRLNLMKMFSLAGMRVSLPDGSHQKDIHHIEDMFRHHGNKLGVVFDSSCYSSSLPFRQRYSQYFNGSYAWLVFDAGSFNRSIEYLKSLPITIMSDIIMVKTIEDSDAISFELYDVYNSGFDRDGVFNVTFISSWIPTSERMMYGRLRDFTILSKIARRSNLHGLNIKVVTYNEFNTENKDIVTYMEQDTQLHKDSVFKMNFRIVQLIKNIFNFTTTYLLADNWSDKNALGYYQSGNLLGILIEKKADIMAAALELSPDRLDITDTIHLTYPFRSGFVFVYEGDFGKIKLSFLTPFSDLIWYLFLALSALIMFITWFILLVESKYLPMSRKFKWKLNFSDTFLSVWAAWCQMGSGIRPTTHASKMVYFTLLLNSVVMYNFYTSSIVSSLLSYRSQAFTIPELADSPMVCGSVDVGYVHYLLFDDPQYPNMEYFNARKKTSNFYFPIEEGLSKVRAGGFAYHAEYNNMYNEISDTFAAWQICELQEVDTIPLVHLAIMGAKNSPYSELFRVGSQKIRETGQLHRLLQKWVSKRPACQANRGFSIVNFHQLFSFFILLMLGMILAILILIYERRNQRFQLHNQIQNKVNDTIKTLKKKRQDRHPDRHFYQ